MTSPSRILLALVLAGAAALALSGCTAGGGGSSSSVDQVPAQDEAATVADPDSADAAVIITGRVVITADSPVAAADEATDIAIDAGGRVDARSEHASGEGGDATAELTMRIPATAVEEVRVALRDLGTVEETSLETAEVGGQQRDLTARITTLTTSIARYNEWLATADKTSDLIDLESAIAERQSELELLQGELHALEDQVAMSTITVTIRSEYVPTSTAPTNLGEALAVGWTGFVAFWSGVVIALGVALPWLVLLAAIAAVVMWLVARKRRRVPASAVALQTPLQKPHPALFEAAGGPVEPAQHPHTP